ncbi:MAG TPA: RIP metalloprotease RseP, partial [Planctomycetota bacterium]|nr:RIP metalloprotease RseP [Planctomycetota bacterium]
MSVLVDVGRYALTVFGIGFIIFVHELGHFLAARAMGVRVEAFSIGFGPRLFGFRRGNTDYKISLIPLGGFVKMAGESPEARPESDGLRTRAPDEFAAKSVPRRVLIICAGVIMNLVFALVALPVAFTWGVPFEAPKVGALEVGGPAWSAGVRRGDSVRAVDGVETLSFQDVAVAVATGDDDVTLTLERDGRRFDVAAKPRVGERGFPSLEMYAAHAPMTFDLASADPDKPAHTPAGHRGRAGVRPGDVLVAIDDVPVEDWMQSGAAVRLMNLETRTVVLRRGGDDVRVTVPPLPRPRTGDGAKVFGLTSADLKLAEVRPDSAAARAGLKAGERVLAADGAPLDGRDALFRALGGASTLVVESADGAERRVALDDPLRDSLRHEVAFARDELTLSPAPGGAAAAAGVRPGDRLVRIDGKPAVAFSDLRGAPSDAPVRLGLRRRGPEGWTELE